MTKTTIISQTGVVDWFNAGPVHWVDILVAAGGSLSSRSSPFRWFAGVLSHALGDELKMLEAGV